ncbi:unnamed protein product [Clonostachys rhizophaga]|uniref:Aldehyde dehydrogenase domain-containing protein n=1 Tax=Clonostachys rhizophaga TaxID=160324 RepID=A0A9N9V8Y7_9HYPO|nr:unnamed protein product [Clonostachys rhizophaga]
MSDLHRDLPPQVSKPHYEKTLGYAESARQDSATVLAGGQPTSNKPHGKGYFIDATVVGDVKPSMKVYQAHIFGPFAVFFKFTSEEEVMQVAEETEYGLAATLFRTDVTRVRLRAGNIWINSNKNSVFRDPLGGMKQSGIGRERERLVYKHTQQSKLSI